MSLKIEFLRKIYSLFHGQNEESFLQVEKNDKGYALARVDWENTKTHDSLENFKEIFGLGNLEHFGIDEKDPSLTKNRLRHIFIHLAAFNRGNNQLFFSSLEEMKMIFFDSAPELEDFRIDKTKTSGKGCKGLAERVFLQWHHYFSILEEKDPIKQMLRDVEFLCSRMADREFQREDSVYLSDGIYDVDRLFIGGGAYVSLLRNRQSPLSVKIVCRGTAIRTSATGAFLSGINDFQIDVGNMGVKSIWPELSEYLKEEKIENIEILGKSLGGAHGQRLALLITSLHNCQLSSVTTLCSIGAGFMTNQLFLKVLKEKKQDNPITIRVIRNGGREGKEQPDYTHLFGGDHLGVSDEESSLKVEVYTIAQTDEMNEEDKVNGVISGENSLYKLFKVFQSFVDGHIRQITLTDFTYALTHDFHDIQIELKRGRELENYRRSAAWALAIATFGLIQGKPISDELKQ